MTTNHESHAIDIDAVISEVAREMTNAGPATDLRARVLSRLDDRSSRGLWRWMPLVTFAASVVIVVGTWALWPSAARPAAIATTTVARIDAAVAPAISHAIETGASIVRVQRAAGSHRPSPEAMSEAELAWNARAIPALSGPTPLTIDPLDHPGVTIAPIEIQPLVTEPLAIKAIGAGSEILK